MPGYCDVPQLFTTPASERFPVVLADGNRRKTIPEGSGHFRQEKAMQRPGIQLGLLIAITSGMPSARTSLWRRCP